MLRRLVCAAVAVLGLVLVPAALADGGPSPGVMMGGPGISSPDGNVRYTTLPGGSGTVIQAVRVRDAAVMRFTVLGGAWGIPMTTYGGSLGGLSADGRTIVLSDSTQCCGLKTETTFLALNAHTFRTRMLIRLHGDFAFDALSPNGRRLYLIQHVSSRDMTRYVVRSYDLLDGKLLPGAIADRTQRGWVMAGSPVNRATSPNGRWVYTLYQRNGAYPFVHALDTVRGVAHCIGIPWTGNDNAVWNMVLASRNGGNMLAIHWRSGRPYLLMDTRTWRLSSPGTFAWWWIVLAACGGLALLVLSRGTLRRARRSAPALAGGGSGPMPALHDARPAA